MHDGRFDPSGFYEFNLTGGTVRTRAGERVVMLSEGVLSALEQGQTIDRLLAALQHWCNRPLPPTWKDKMHTWSQNYGKLHIYDDISLIELADDYALQEILSSTSLREHLIHQFSSRLVAIHADAIDDLVLEMEKRGYTPYVE